jgi:hypothetical protein
MGEFYFCSCCFFLYLNFILKTQINKYKITQKIYKEKNSFKFIFLSLIINSTYFEKEKERENNGLCG